MRLAALLPLLAMFGCAPVLSTFVPARTTPKGHFRGSLGLGVSIPAGQIGDLEETAETISKKAAADEPISDKEQDDLYEAVIGLGLSPPSVADELQARWGFGKRWDLGFRSAGSALRLDGRYTFLRDEDSGIDASAGLGIGRFTFEIPLPPVVEDVVEVDDFTRYEFDVPVLFGWSKDWAHLWFGPKVVFTAYGSTVTLNLAGAEQEIGDVHGTSWYYGVQAGGALGYKYAWLAFELTVSGLSGSADVDVTPASRTAHADFGGLVLYPSFGVLLQF
jgi:hypothetical protein